jgi:hypothetical protein
MRRVWQAVGIFLVTTMLLGADEQPKLFKWNSPNVRVSMFTSELGLLDLERDEYATNLARLASDRIAAAKASPASLITARHMIALALQLSPRNRKALILNFQLGKGILPADKANASVPTNGDYSSDVFARLILARGKSLYKVGGAQNILVARYLVKIAADLDPTNEDAVYACEVQRLDNGDVDWDLITDPHEQTNLPATENAP